MISRLVLALVVAIVTGLGCLLLGLVLVQLKVPIALTVGEFIETWAWVIGLLAGLWYFFSGSTWTPFGPRA